MATKSATAAAALLSLSFFFFTLVNSDQSDPDPQSSSECANRWIHIRNLPPQFNLDLLSTCSHYPLFDDFCLHLPNHGLGHKTHNNTRSWFRTDTFMLELIFHRRMLEYPCLTTDPSAASAVYLPYYAGLDSLRYLYDPNYFNFSSNHGLNIYQFLNHRENSPEIWNRNNGHDHFLVASRPAWDLSQPLSNDPPVWGTSLLELPQFYNVTVLTFESRAYPWQEVAIPYPTSFHPPNTAMLDSWVSRVRQSRRTTLMLFAGGGGGGGSSSPNIRRSIRMECENSTGGGGGDVINRDGLYTRLCEFVDCSNGVCEHDPIKFMRPMLQSTFCLQPPGDTPTRRSTFDGILAGCIPVFFEEQSARKQYGWHLPEAQYGDFSVFIPKEDVVFKGLRILDVLLGIPRGEVRRMREKVVELIPRVMYRKHGSSFGLRSKKDAFDIAVEGTLERIKSRLQEVSVH